MARFEPIWESTIDLEKGYQADAKDSGNYCPPKGQSGAQVIGTNHGISAIAYKQYFGSCPTVQQMKSLTQATAKKIGKVQFWDPLLGDKIKSQAVAHIIFDATFNSGSYGPQQVRKTINALKGQGTVAEGKSMSLSAKEVELVNSLPEKRFFDTFAALRKQFFAGQTYEAGLNNRLNKLKAVYVNTLEDAVATGKKYLVPLIVGSLVLGAGIFIIIYYKNKK